MLCFVYVVTTIVIDVDIGANNKKTWAICEVMVKVLSPIMMGYVLSKTHIQFIITKTCKI
jgi:hypothetical protein